VLPADVPESLVAPQPAVSLVPARRRRLWPPVLALLLVGSATAVAWWRWRARGAVSAPAGPVPTVTTPVERWAGAGEVRAVAGAAAASLRSTIAQLVPSAHAGLDTEACLRRLDDARPGWPLGEIGRLLRELDLVRFGPERPGADALVLHGQARELAERLRSAGEGDS
jgi:hypothetical protein